LARVAMNFSVISYEYQVGCIIECLQQRVVKAVDAHAFTKQAEEV
jgi:hypothetical protein